MAAAAASAPDGSDGDTAFDGFDRSCTVRPATIRPADEQPEPKTGNFPGTAGYSGRTFDGAAAAGAILFRGQAAPSAGRRGN